MTIVFPTDRYKAVQYDGTNAAEVASIFDANYAQVSATGSQLDFTYNGTPRTAFTTDWVRTNQGFWFGTFTNAEFTSQQIVLADGSGTQTQIDALDSRLDTLEGQTLDARLDVLEAAPDAELVSAGIRETPTLLLGQSANIAVDIIPAMPDSSYTASAQLFASASALGSLSITGVSVTDADTVTVTVQNSGLVNLSGVHVLVVCRK